MALIYEPAGRAREYAALACNVYRGCDHRCTYCYAPSATQTAREAFGKPRLREGFLTQLEKEAEAIRPGAQVLLSFTCDPYQLVDCQHFVTRKTIMALHRHGLFVCVLTKGGGRALRDLDLFGPGDAFATTLTFLDAERSRKWEPGAALPDSRLRTIQAFHDAGIETWVSLEPVIDPAASLEIIRRTAGYVDLFKVGKLNHHPLAATIDWRAFALNAVALLKSLGKAYYIKNDLAAFVPELQLPAMPQHAAPPARLPQFAQARLL